MNNDFLFIPSFTKVIKELFIIEILSNICVDCILFDKYYSYFLNYLVSF